jgi:hypothetical protein
MKTISQASILILNTSKGPAAKTIFTIKNDSEKESSKYFNLEKLSGKSVTISYTYSENEQEHQATTCLAVPAGLTEDQVKQFIINSISN